MSKTEKELAFLRDLYVETDWTERFTNLLDENFKFSGEEKILYVNAGAGNHALALREKLDDEIEIFGVSESQELLNIPAPKPTRYRRTWTSPSSIRKENSTR